jgi:hypothetical protein
LKDAQARFQKIEDGDVDFAHDKRRYESALKKAKRDVERAQRNKDKIVDQREKLSLDREALNTSLSAREAERANAEEKAELEIDAKKKAYDDYLDEVEKKDKKAAEKWAQDVAKIEERQRQKEERERERAEEEAERRLHRLRVKNAREEASERAGENLEAQGRLAAARSLVSQQWGFYRDKNSLAAHLREQDANLAAQEQYAKDLRHITHGRNAGKFAELDNLNRTLGWGAVEDRLGEWRKRKLVSADDEAIMRVGVAQNEERRAAQYAQQTAEASQRAADALESINNILTAAESE